MSTIYLWYTGFPSFGLDPKDPAILGLKACSRPFVNLTQLKLDPSTSRFTVQASSNCAIQDIKPRHIGTYVEHEHIKT